MSQPNQHQLRLVVKQIARIIDTEKRQITNREMLELCEAEGIKSLSTDPHLCHEIAETALNHLVRMKYGKMLLHSADPIAGCLDLLRPLQTRLPTQTWRSSTQITFQQFSTPAPIAYLASYLLNLNSDDIVLEPSCGTGNLAVWAQSSGASVVTNEIDLRRRELARLLDFDPTSHNAEFIDDFLPESIVPNVVLANPPFSSSGGRVERNQRKFGFRHVESSLRRLANGGRFAVILGENCSPRSSEGKLFWADFSQYIRLSASIEIPGKEYYRNGTTVGVTLILGNKPSNRIAREESSVQEPINISATSVEDAFDQSIVAGISH